MADPVTADAITLGFAPRPRADVSSVEVEGQLIVYSPDTGAVHQLDAVATTLWRCFDGTTTLREVADDLADIFSDHDPARLDEDLLGYARELGSAGLLDGVTP